MIGQVFLIEELPCIGMRDKVGHRGNQQGTNCQDQAQPIPPVAKEGRDGDQGKHLEQRRGDVAGDARQLRPLSRPPAVGLLLSQERQAQQAGRDESELPHVKFQEVRAAEKQDADDEAAEPPVLDAPRQDQQEQAQDNLQDQKPETVGLLRRESYHDDTKRCGNDRQVAERKEVWRYIGLLFRRVRVQSGIEALPGMVDGEEVRPRTDSMDGVIVQGPDDRPRRLRVAAGVQGLGGNRLDNV